jgi:hypothetical protein
MSKQVNYLNILNVPQHTDNEITFTHGGCTLFKIYVCRYNVNLYQLSKSASIFFICIHTVHRYFVYDVIYQYAARLR